MGKPCVDKKGGWFEGRSCDFFSQKEQVIELSVFIHENVSRAALAVNDGAAPIQYVLTFKDRDRYS